MPPTTAGPSDLAGLKLPPVRGPVTSAPAKTVAPIANGATAVGVRSSVSWPTPYCARPDRDQRERADRLRYVSPTHTGSGQPFMAAAALPPVRKYSAKSLGKSLSRIAFAARST